VTKKKKKTSVKKTTACALRADPIALPRKRSEKGPLNGDCKRTTWGQAGWIGFSTSLPQNFGSRKRGLRHPKQKLGFSRDTTIGVRREAYRSSAKSSPQAGTAQERVDAYEQPLSKTESVLRPAVHERDVPVPPQGG